MLKLCLAANRAKKYLRTGLYSVCHKRPSRIASYKLSNPFVIRGHKINKQRIVVKI